MAFAVSIPTICKNNFYVTSKMLHTIRWGLVQRGKDRSTYRTNEADLRRVEGNHFSELHFFFFLISVKLPFFTQSLPEFQWEHAVPHVTLLEFSPSSVFVLLLSWARYKNLLRPLCLPDSCTSESLENSQIYIFPGPSTKRFQFRRSGVGLG